MKISRSSVDLRITDACTVCGHHFPRGLLDAAPGDEQLLYDTVRSQVEVKVSGEVAAPMQDAFAR